MIRPLTIATFFLACGSGLYLYQSKHEVQLLDRTIERSVHDTGALREQSRLLAAEWTMLNDPERLRQFSDTYLKLKTITPSQFSSLADLDSRLPAPRAANPPQESDEPELEMPQSELRAPGAADPISTGVALPSAAIANQALPVPPVPVAAVAAAAVAHTPMIKIPERPPIQRQVAADNQTHSGTVTEARASDQRLPDQHPAEQHVTPRVADTRTDIRAPGAPPPPRPIVLAAPRPPVATNAPMKGSPAMVPDRSAMAVQSVPVSGSLLGAARGSAPPAPRPTPVNAMYHSN